MKKGNLKKNLFQEGEKTASYIVAHARWQMSRGRRPSESYRGERNPRKALSLAREEVMSNLEYGVQVKTNKHLFDTRGILIAQKHLDVRTPNKKGFVTGWVPGHGGDVWWVMHRDNTVGVYATKEFTPA